MTLEEVIEYLEKMIEIDKIYEVSSGTEENRQLAEWLKELKAYREQGGDAINRQIISDYVGSHIQEINTGYGDINKHTNEILRMIVDYIESMPSVSPQQKMGRWTIKDGKEQGYDIGGVKTWYIQIMCSECGFIKTAIEGHMGQYNYCPNCGQPKMEVKE